MSDDHIRYDILTQDALRRVIRKVLEEVQRTGLPGQHHFFITFQTAYPGVRLTTRMMERYPDEMTIVIQHSYWNLEVTETGFEIDLSFDDIRERLRIPFDAVRGFYDPSVKFGLQFDATPMAALPKPESTETETAAKAPTAISTAAPKLQGMKAKTSADTKIAKATEKATDEKPSEAGADVVSLDAFRKKK